MNNLLNRTTVLYLTNKSGGTVSKGDTVIIDSANNQSFTTTTTSGYVNGVVGVVLDATIANNTVGAIAVAGWIPQINLSSSASLNDLFKTHTVAKQSVPHAAPAVSGDFGQVLSSGTMPPAILFTVNQGGSGGGRTLIDSQSLSGASSVTFSAIPQIYEKLTFEFIVRSTQAANAVDAYLQFNGDTTAANYLFELIRENQTGRANEFGANFKIASATIPGSSAPTGEYAVGEITIIGYTNTFFNKKAHQFLESVYDNASVFMQIQSGGLSWTNDDAITSIVFALSAGNGAANSVVNLYGE